jgi:hypothetical protein
VPDVISHRISHWSPRGLDRRHRAWADRWQVQRIHVKPLEQASVFLAAGPRIFDVTAAGVVAVARSSA